jgi:plasmid stabilization system protein ParE
MKFRVKITWRAERDLDRIVLWISEKSAQGAAAWLRRWRKVLDDLRKRPDKCGLAPEGTYHDVEIRQIVFKTRSGLPYRALFTIRDDNVYILHVRGPMQDLVAPDDLQLPTDE